MKHTNSMRHIRRLPKLCGADIELGNFVLGLSRSGGTGYEASRALLREIQGLPQHSSGSSGWSSVVSESSYYSSKSDRHCGWSSRNGGYGYCGYDPQDWGRKFLAENGGCVYIDLDHLEVCLPEVISAWDHVAAWHAMLRIVQGALAAANRKLPAGQRIQVLVNNSDSQSNSYGSHLNFCLPRRTWDNIFLRKVHQLLYLAAYQVSSIVITGQGKVGAENDAPAVDYQLSQRADYFETLQGLQTTYHRPLVNSRDESLSTEYARLHVIFFDNTLAHVSCLLKCGMTQIILAMIEAEKVNPSLILDDPVEAVVHFSHDPTLKARARLASGQNVSAVELQLMFLEEAAKFVNEGGCDGIVPRAGEILALWEDTLQKLREGDFDSLAPRLDWVLKHRILQRALERVPGLSWNSPQMRHLDLIYSSLDPGEGLYWAYENSLIHKVVGDEQIRRFVENPPEDTRAYARAMLLRVAEPRAIDDVDWDCIRFKLNGRYWPTYRTLRLGDPLGHTRSETESVFRRSRSLEELLEEFEAGEPEAKGGALIKYLPS